MAVPALYDTGLVTPYAGTILAEGAGRTYRVGTRLLIVPGLGTSGTATGLTMTLEGLRHGAHRAATAQPGPPPSGLLELLRGRGVVGLRCANPTYEYFSVIPDLIRDPVSFL